MKTLRISILSALCLIFSLAASGQYVTRVAEMDSSVLETSGLIYLDNRLITHNDSGDQAALYEIDTANGRLVRKVILRNAFHADWEDICCDSHYIYIGDFGNNLGNRKDLVIYKLKISDYLTSDADSLDVERIHFSYADQENFRSNPFYTNYDAEALISLHDSLYIFTKNWGDGLSYIYACPKEPGNYELQMVDVIQAKGWITGADYQEESNTILLCGYVFFFPFLMEISNFSGNNFSGGTLRSYFLPREGSTQLEGITRIADGRFFFSTEANRRGESTLYGLNSADLLQFKRREKQLASNLLIQILSLGKDTAILRMLWRALLWAHNAP